MQDGYVAQSYRIGDEQAYMYAVFDGHGPQGHVIVDFLKGVLLSILTRHV